MLVNEPKMATPDLISNVRQECIFVLFEFQVYWCFDRNMHAEFKGFSNRYRHKEVLYKREGEELFCNESFQNLFRLYKESESRPNR